MMQHTYLNVTSFVCNIEEKCQVFFSIYDARESRFIRSVNNRNVADIHHARINMRINNCTLSQRVERDLVSLDPVVQRPIKLILV